VFPATTPLNTPFAEIVATERLLDVQAPPDTEDVRLEEPLAQIAAVPEIFPAVGTAVTLTIVVCVAVTFEQLPVPVTVYVMVVVPALTPVTAPVVLLMAATVGIEEVQAPPGTDDVNVADPFAQMAVVPVMLPAVGAAVTVTVVVAVALTPAQLPVPFTV
jgi:hypothetical protein